MIDKNMMDVREAAKKIGVHFETLKRAIKAGQLEAYLLGGEYRITEEALAAYVESKKVRVEK